MVLPESAPRSNLTRLAAQRYSHLAIYDQLQPTASSLDGYERLAVSANALLTITRLSSSGLRIVVCELGMTRVRSVDAALRPHAFDAYTRMKYVPGASPVC